MSNKVYNYIWLTVVLIPFITKLVNDWRARPPKAKRKGKKKIENIIKPEIYEDFKKRGIYK